jgi:hypothetical protein
MSDAKLRDLERRWKETGSVEDEAAYLLERVRVGDLTRERLELAAYCGHEGAMSAIGSQLDSGAPTVWMVGLARWGSGPILIAAAAAVRLVTVTPMGDEQQTITATVIETVAALATATSDGSAKLRNRIGECVMGLSRLISTGQEPARRTAMRLGMLAMCRDVEELGRDSAALVGQLVDGLGGNGIALMTAMKGAVLRAIDGYLRPNSGST